MDEVNKVELRQVMVVPPPSIDRTAERNIALKSLVQEAVNKLNLRKIIIDVMPEAKCNLDKHSHI